MFRRFIAMTAVVSMALIVLMLRVPAASALSPDVTITATGASNGTTTLTYRATATSAGTVRYIQVALPPGTSGLVTSINGAVTTVAPNVLRWTPSRTVTVGVGARFSLPFYGLKLPSGSSWTLGFNATSTSGTRISYGWGVLTGPATTVYTPDVRITATNPIPGQSTNLTYTGVVTQTGVLTSIGMQLPTDATGIITSVNGTLTTANGYSTWTPRAPISVSAGARLVIPLYGVMLSRYGGVMALSMTARTSTGGSLMSGSGALALIAPPAPMPSVTVAGFAPVPKGCPTSWPSTAQENAMTGTGDWVIPATMDGALAAYLTQVSATCGDSVDLKVTSGNPVSIVAYRMGYYGGLGAREVWRADQVPTVVQPTPVTTGTDAQGHDLRMTTAVAWSTTATIPITAAWVPGTYLIKVSDGTNAAYAPLTVRDDTGTKHAVLIQQATTTWEAYNSYGGVSFYSGLTTGSGRLSFDRPYSEGQGSGQFLPLEQGLVFWAESKGLDVTYWTDNDLDEFGGQLPARASTIFLPAHDEYYSLPMRAALNQAIGRGVNVANLGANTVYRRITFTDDSRRTWDIDRYTDGYSSTVWRYLGDAYASQPFLGAEYLCAVVGDTLTAGSSWLFTGIPTGTAIPGFIAGEFDRVDPGLYRQPGLAVIATGNATCRLSTLTSPMHTTTFTAPSGARIFNASTFAYSCFLVGRCPANWAVPSPDASSQRAVGLMMANVTTWVSDGTIQVPDTTTIAPLKVATPKHTVQMLDQP